MRTIQSNPIRTAGVLLFPARWNRRWGAMNDCTDRRKRQMSEVFPNRGANRGAANPSPDSYISPVELDGKDEKPVISKAAQKEAFRTETDDATIDLRALKTMLEQRLPPSHPLRVLVVGEPDFMPRSEYRSKLPGWFRILMNRAD